MEEYGAEGNINIPKKRHPIGMPEYNDLIEAALLARLKPGYIANIQEEGREEPTDDADILTFIKDILIDCEAVVAGGFLLGTIHDYNGKNNFDKADFKLDMDFYVPCRHLVKFNKVFAKLIDAHSVSQHNATFYCRSFLRRNGIRSVQTFYAAPAIVQNGNWRHEVKLPLIDIMAVRNARSPLDVVQNFDLSFCQLWYDGKGVWATHPQDVKTKTGILQGDYVKVLIENNNKFLKRRIQKYKNRGFKIQYDSDVIKSMGEIEIQGLKMCPPNTRDETYFNRWVTRFVLHSLLYTKYSITNGYMVTKHDERNDTQRGFPDNYFINNGYRLINDKRASIDTMQIINVADGYDTDDYDITTPANFYPELNRIAVNLPAEIQQAWIAQPNDLKFHKVMNILWTNYYSTDLAKSPISNSLDYNIRELRRKGLAQDRIDYEISEEIFFKLHDTQIRAYTNSLARFIKRDGMDAISLDDVPVHDLHLHTADEAIGREGIKQHLDALIGQRDKSHLPCYLTTCTMNLTLDEIRGIVDSEYYLRFAAPIAAPLPPPDALLGELPTGEMGPDGTPITVELGTIIRNASSSTDGWGNIFHWVMCPFCLGYIGRQQGCTYVTHVNPNRLPGSFSPYCKEQNIIKEVRDKYVNAGYDGFEICIECGRACSHHQHFDLNNPPGLAHMPLTARGDPDYSRCAGGGRREALARMIAVRKTVQDNPGMEPIALRRLAGLAAEAAANDDAFLTYADIILAKPAATRVNANLNIPANFYNAVGIAINGNAAVHGGHRVGAVCPHGYENYREKIPKTRKHSQKKRRGTRKSKTN
jgi:hypothetical protein